jgi:FixJ family two-component response regulator
MANLESWEPRGGPREALMTIPSTAGHDARSSNVSDAPPIVFVVDDDISVRESLEALIRCAGWRTETFASAREFLDRPRGPAPSCLICDVTLPDLNGLELQKVVAADGCDTPIVFITGYDDVAVTTQAMKAGAVEFLTKPFGDDALLATVAKAIERSKAARGAGDSNRSSVDI